MIAHRGHHPACVRGQILTLQIRLLACILAMPDRNVGVMRNQPSIPIHNQQA